MTTCSVLQFCLRAAVRLVSEALCKHLTVTVMFTAQSSCTLLQAFVMQLHM